MSLAYLFFVRVPLLPPSPPPRTRNLTNGGPGQALILKTRASNAGCISGFVMATALSVFGRPFSHVSGSLAEKGTVCIAPASPYPSNIYFPPGGVRPLETAFILLHSTSPCTSHIHPMRRQSRLLRAEQLLSPGERQDSTTVLCGVKRKAVRLTTECCPQQMQKKKREEKRPLCKGPLSTSCPGLPPESRPQ